MKSDQEIVMESRAAFAVVAISTVLFAVAWIKTADGTNGFRTVLSWAILACLVMALPLLTIRIEWSARVFRRGYLFGHLGDSVFRAEDLLSMTIRRDHTSTISRVTLRFMGGNIQLHRYQTGYQEALSRLQLEFPRQFSEAKAARF